MNKNSIIKYISIIIGLIIFSIWMNIVGNPHVVETTIGVILSIVAGVFSFKELNKLVKR
jgi:hypothetical protein